MSEAIRDAARGVLAGPMDTVAGPVVRPPGFSGIRLPSGRDAAVAAWLRDHMAEFEAFLANPGGEATPPGSGMSSEDSDALRWGDFLQIWNDFKHLMGDDPCGPVSPTIRFTLDRAEVGPGSRVLEIGGSLGRHLLHLAERGPELLAVLDYNLFPLVLGATAWEAKKLDPPLLRVWGDGLALPFRDGAFTHVNTFVTLSWLPIRGALEQARRVLEPGGRLTLTIEGPGFWIQNWEKTRGLGRGRLARFREYAAYRLTGLGIDWPPSLPRLAGHTVYDEATIARRVRRAGFEVDHAEVLTEYGGRPRLIGLTATRRTVG